MMRISTIFVAICMLLIAGALGLLLYRIAGLPAIHAAIGGGTALFLMILFSVVSARSRERVDLGGQLADLAQGTTDLARQVAEFGRRLHAVEARMSGFSPQGDRRNDPLRQEISELGMLMKQVAVSVAEHDDALRALSRPPAIQAFPGQSSPAPASPDQMTMELRPAPNIPAAPPAAAARTTAQMPAPAIPPQTRAPIQAVAPSAQLPDPMEELARQAVESGRIEMYLQPVVTLPQRKVRHYEAVARLRDRSDAMLPAADFIEAAARAGVLARIDETMLLRCVQVLRRLNARNKDVGLFCNLSLDLLRDPAVFARCLDFLDSNRALAAALVLEFKHSTLRALGPVEAEHLAALAQRGFKFSIDHVSDLRFNPRELADRGVRFIKIGAALLLDPGHQSDADIHPSDLSDMLRRFGIELVAERIEQERAVVDLLDFDIRFGQGFLFAPPRALRPEAISAVDNPAQAATQAATNEPAAPDGAATPAAPAPESRGIAALLARRISASN